jgi:hypothetical protein
VWRGTSEDYTPFSEDEHEYILRHTQGANPGFVGPEPDTILGGPSVRKTIQNYEYKIRYKS